MRIQSQVTVRRPVEEVFAVFTDVTQTPKWASAAEKEWWVTPPPHGVGSVRHAVGTAFGRRFENDATVVEYDPPRRGVLAGEMSGTKFRVAIDFEPVPEGTQVAVTADVQLAGAMRLMARMVGGRYKTMWDGDLATFKRMMEAGELH